MTPFVTIFLDIIKKSVMLLVEALEKRRAQMLHYLEHIRYLPEAESTVVFSLYNYLIQAQLFSEHGISTKELLSYLELSRDTLRKKLEIVEKAHLLKTERIKNEKFYGIDLDMLDGFIEWRNQQILNKPQEN